MKGSRTIRRAAVGAVLVAASAAVGVPVGATSSSVGAQAPPAPTDYIVTLEPGQGNVTNAAERQLDRLGSEAGPDKVFGRALRGYTAELTESEANDLENVAGVRSVEPDGMVFLTDTQQDPPWGVDRTDQADLPLSGDYTWTADGTGVTAYVIDSGVRASHSDFGGRASTGVDIVDGGPADDCLGHGTHVSSTIGGATHGVAKNVSLVAVRVFGCQSTAPASDVIAGVDWAVGDHEAGEPAVANMSLAYTASPALDQAVQNLIDDGVAVSIAAGNGIPGLNIGTNACDWSPARVPGALTVAASNVNDALAAFSNKGNCVDLIAPGVEVPGAWHTGDDATANASGTSMAAPHVAGAAAKQLQLAPDATPDAVAAALTQAATPDRIAGTGPTCIFIFCIIPATPNLLVYSDL